MKNKLIKLMAFISACLIMHVAGAQDTLTRGPGFTPEQKAERMTIHLKQKLSLTDEQSVNVKAVYMEHLKKMDSRNGKRKEAHAELENSLSKVLSQDQLEKFKKLEAERRDQMKARKNQQIQQSQDVGDPKKVNEQQSEQK